MEYNIEFDQVSKRYRLGSGLSSIRELFSKNQSGKLTQYHWAVRDVNFKLGPGESLAIIGPNGAGKTTILKLLSRVTKPTTGVVHIRGRFSSLIELGAGFHPDLTGRENIYLNGTILGMKRAEIRRRFDHIVEFSGIGEYLDTPVKRYSSGMYARLGFAIAAHVDPDVLLVDEVLAVGDYAFQIKCYARMEELRSKGTTLVFVSHNMDAVRRVCRDGMVMYKGQAIFYGTASEAIVAYSDAIRTAARKMSSDFPKENGLSERVMTFDAEIERVRLINQEGQLTNMIQANTTAKVEVDVIFHKPVKQPIFSLTVRTPEGQLVYDTTTRWKNIKTPDFNSGTRCRVEFILDMPLLEGEYWLGVDVVSTTFSHYYDRLERAMGFWVKGSDEAKGLVDLHAKVLVKGIE